MATIKKACKGALYPKSSSVSSRLGSYGKKMKSGGSLGMKSVKAGFDKNPGVTRADIIVAGKGEAKKGMKVKKAQAGKTLPFVEKVKDTTSTKKYPSGDMVPSSPNYKGPKGKTSMVPKKSMKTGGKMSKKCKYGCK